MRWLAYQTSRFLIRCILALVCRTRVLHGERARRRGGWLLACNHISHFDPPFLTMTARRKIDWMATRELYSPAPVALWMHAVDTFPIDREHVDGSAVREALRRLRRGRVVGIFPEGGIRDGERSVLFGAALKPGLAALAQMSGAPVIPCVLLGSDQLYTPGNWRPFRRARAWLIFGEPLQITGKGREARAAFEAEIGEAMRTLLAELQQHFSLTADAFPQSPGRRKGRV